MRTNSTEKMRMIRARIISVRHDKSPDPLDAGYEQFLDFLEGCVVRGELKEVLEAIRLLPRVVSGDPDQDSLIAMYGDTADETYKDLVAMLLKHRKFDAARQVVQLTSCSKVRIKLLLEIVEMSKNAADAEALRAYLTRVEDQGERADVYASLFAFTKLEADAESARAAVVLESDNRRTAFLWLHIASKTGALQDLRMAFADLQNIYDPLLAKIIEPLLDRWLSKISRQVVLDALMSIESQELRQQVKRVLRVENKRAR